MGQAGTEVALLNGCIRLIAAAYAINKIRLVPFIRKVALILSDDLSITFQHLPPSSVAAQIHHLVCPVDFNATRTLRPERPSLTVADFMGEFLRVACKTTALASHRKA